MAGLMELPRMEAGVGTGVGRGVELGGPKAGHRRETPAARVAGTMRDPTRGPAPRPASSPALSRDAPPTRPGAPWKKDTRPPGSGRSKGRFEKGRGTKEKSGERGGREGV